MAKSEPKPNYWIEKRTVDVILASELKGVAAVRRVLPLYEEALKGVQRQINDVYRRYSNNTGIDASKLKQIINGNDKANFLKSIKANIKKVGLKFTDVYSDGHVKALSNLEALKQQIYWEIMAIAPNEREISGKTYIDVVQNTYGGVNTVIANAFGLNSSFGDISNHTLSALLSSKWEGKSFSQRVWGNTNKLALKLPELVAGAILSGESYAKTTQRVKQQFGVSKYEARRLVLTETAYYASSGELLSYQENAVLQYTYSAILDAKTSKICIDHNGQTYYVKDAVVGVNFPPLHPHCRSTTYAVLPDFAAWLANREAKEQDVLNPDTSPIPAPANEGITTLDGTKLSVPQKPLIQNPDIRLDSAEQVAAKSYQSGEYRKINSFLREGKDSGISYDMVLGSGQTVTETIANIDSVIDKSPIREAATVYRGLPVEWASRFNVGETYSDRAYQSFSRNLDIVNTYYADANLPVIMKVELPKGYKAMQPSNISGISADEDEFVLGRNTQLTVKSIKGYRQGIMITMSVIKRKK